LQPRIAPNSQARLHNHADVDVPASGADGVIIAQGSRYGGITLFVKESSRRL